VDAGRSDSSHAPDTRLSARRNTASTLRTSRPCARMSRDPSGISGTPPRRRATIARWIASRAVNASRKRQRYADCELKVDARVDASPGASSLARAFRRLVGGHVRDEASWGLAFVCARCVGCDNRRSRLCIDAQLGPARDEWSPRQDSSCPVDVDRAARRIVDDRRDVLRLRPTAFQYRTSCVGGLVHSRTCRLRRCLRVPRHTRVKGRMINATPLPRREEAAGLVIPRRAPPFVLQCVRRVSTRRLGVRSAPDHVGDDGWRTDRPPRLVRSSLQPRSEPRLHRANDGGVHIRYLARHSTPCSSRSMVASAPSLRATTIR